MALNIYRTLMEALQYLDSKPLAPSAFHVILMYEFAKCSILSVIRKMFEWRTFCAYGV